MLNERKMCVMEDKLVSTSDEFLNVSSSNLYFKKYIRKIIFYKRFVYIFQRSFTNEDRYEGQVRWNILTVEKLLTALTNAKLMSIREMMMIDGDADEFSYSYKDDYKDPESGGKK